MEILKGASTGQGTTGATTGLTLGPMSPGDHSAPFFPVMLASRPRRQAGGFPSLPTRKLLKHKSLQNQGPASRLYTVQSLQKEALGRDFG